MSGRVHNLAGVAPGEYTLIAAPLRLVGVEAAPARALLLDRAP
jgi:arylformamidase